VTARPPAAQRPPIGRDLPMIALGGAIGAVARTAQSASFAVAEGQLPWSTFAENLTGAFLLGLFATTILEGRWRAWWARPLLGTGLLGAYTTYATVGLELHQLVLDGRAALAGAYLTATAVLGLLAGGAGVVLARLVNRRGPTGRRREARR
jgi:fluoride exporter